MNLNPKSAVYHNYFKILGIIALMLGVTAYMIAPTQVQASTSTHCHVTDGAFTHCPDSTTEWSDITPVSFNGGQSYLYADEAKFNPSLTGTVDTLFLMYDDVVRTSPLGPNEYVQVSFKTVEDIGGGVMNLQHYTIHIYGDGTFSFFENGVLHTTPDGATRYTELEDQRATAGFGTSPNSAVPHVMAEFQIGLTASGAASYSPDPLFWQSGIPQLPDLKCYSIIDAPPGQIVHLADQFGIEQNVTVGQAIDLCVTAVKSIPGSPGPTPSFQLALKCYSITDSSPGVSVNLADQFGPENNIAVGQPDRLCGWVIINPVPGQVPQFKVDFKCYKITDTAPGKTVSLTDQFENEPNVSVGTASHLCAPVTKTLSNGQEFAPPPPLDRLHYKCYNIAGTPIGKMVDLQDEFGTEHAIAVKGSDHLCLTASKTPVGTGQPPSLTNPPNLKCYQIQDVAPGRVVNLEDQFGVQTNITVGTPGSFCTTAIKSPPGTTPAFRMDWKCYNVQGVQPNATVNLQDQFGLESNLKVGPLFALCNTVQKTTSNPSSGLPSTTPQPVTLDFSCYGITDKAPGRTVNLTDVFHTELNVVVGPAVLLCVNAVKTPPGTPPQVRLDYKCYQIGGPTLLSRVNMTDEFGTELNVPVIQPVALCEPAVKTHLPPPPPPIQPPPDFKCHTIADTTPTIQIPTAQDQFGFRNGLIVQQPFMLCGLTTKTPPGITPNGNLDLKCYTSIQPARNVTVDLTDQFETEKGVQVGSLFAVCVTAIKNGITPTTHVDFNCYKIFGNQPPKVVNLTDQFGFEPNVRVGQGFALCSSVSFSSSAPPPILWDLKCYTIAGPSLVGVKVTLQDEFHNETNVPVTNPVALCTTVTKTPHITTPIPTPLTNCFFAANTVDTNKTGVGDICRSGHTTSAFLQAHDTGVTVTPESTNQDPSLLTQLHMIVDYRCGSNTACRQKLAMDLVNGEVSNGVISQGDSSGYISSLQQVHTPVLPYISGVAVILALGTGTYLLITRRRQQKL